MLQSNAKLSRSLKNYWYMVNNIIDDILEYWNVSFRVCLLANIWLVQEYTKEWLLITFLRHECFNFLCNYYPLDVIYDSLRSLIIHIFVNSKSVAIMVNSNSKRAFRSNGSNYAGYRENTIDKLLEALELILCQYLYPVQWEHFQTNTWNTYGW